MKSFTRGTKSRRAGDPRRAGVALVSVLVAILGLLALGAAFQQYALGVVREETANLDARRAFYLAETGLGEGMTALRAGATGNVGDMVAPAYLGDGVFWVVATDLGGGRTRLVSTALSGAGRAALEAEVELKAQEPLFSAVLNSKDRLTLNSSVVVDSFDSEAGSYASQAVNNSNGYVHANANGHVSSNQGIVLNAGATVFGDATPGPGYSTSFATGSYVSGSTTPAPTPFAFPPIVVPSVASSGPLTVAAKGSYTLPAGTHGFDALTIGNGATLAVQGPAKVVCTNFTGDKNGKLVIDATNGPVTFYIQGSYSHISGFQALPAAGSPMAVAFMMSAAQDISFPANALIRGAFYVPNANVTFTSGNEVWGAIAANRIDMSSSTRFHYDETLMNHWQNQGQGSGDPLEVQVWRRVEVAPAALLRDRRDPFAVLGVNKTGLLSPAASWVF